MPSAWAAIENTFNAEVSRALHEEDFDLEGALSDVGAASADAFRRARDTGDP